MTTGAHAIVETLVNLGVERIYLFPGGTIAPILDVAVSRGIELVVSRHEQAAGFMAMAEAREARRPAVVAVTSGPGATNLLTAIADAYFDSCPLLVMTGQVSTADLARSRSLRQRGFQECRTAEIFGTVTKAVFEPQGPDELSELVTQAWTVAATGRPGPVLLDLPMDIQRAPAVVPRLDLPDVSDLPQVGGAAWLPDLTAHLSACERPLMLIGHGALSSERSLAELLEVTEGYGIPSVTSIRAIGAVAHSCPTHLGFVGHTGFDCAGVAIQEADLLIVIGSRLDIRQTGTETGDFGRLAKIVRFDIDPTEIDFSRVLCDETYLATSEEALSSLLAALRTVDTNLFVPWLERCAQLKREDKLWEKFGGTPARHEQSRGIDPESLLVAIGRATLKNSFTHFVTGVGSHQQWAARMLPHDQRLNRWHSSAGHGTMGFDLPTANGLRLVDRATPVVCVVGDGSFLLNIQELAVTRMLGGPTAIIVLDNGRFGIVSQFQRFVFGSDPSGVLPREDFVAIANAFGVQGRRISTWAGVEEMCAELPLLAEPTVFQVMIDSNADVTPMLMGGQRLGEMWHE